MERKEACRGRPGPSSLQGLRTGILTMSLSQRSVKRKTPLHQKGQGARPGDRSESAEQTPAAGLQSPKLLPVSDLYNANLC